MAITEIMMPQYDRFDNSTIVRIIVQQFSYISTLISHINVGINRTPVMYFTIFIQMTKSELHLAGIH